MKIRNSLWFVVLMGLVSCRTVAPYEAAAFLTNEGPELRSMKSFTKLRLAALESPEFERARIDYLLERLSYSPYTFVRNGETYSAARAAMHLKWKYALQSKNIHTPDDFIRKVASRSKESGERYYLDQGKDKIYPLNELLENELRLLDDLMSPTRITGPLPLNETTVMAHDPLKESGPEAEDDVHNQLKTQADNA